MPSVNEIENICENVKSDSQVIEGKLKLAFQANFKQN